VVGSVVGCIEGWLVGCVGCVVGCPEGWLVGCVEGWAVGWLVGVLVGVCVVGCIEGWVVGSVVGCFVGVAVSAPPSTLTVISSLSKLKSVIVASNLRHSTYVEKMAQREELIKNDVVAQNFTPESLQRMKEFYHFQSCDLKRQLHIQKKLKLGQGHGFFSNSTDMEFFLHLKTAPDYVHQIHLDMDETRLVQEQQAHKMKCLSNTVVRIENADQIVANARKILKFPTDQNPCALATALAITTGRRMVR
jgi:hypothetical protein